MYVKNEATLFKKTNKVNTVMYSPQYKIVVSAWGLLGFALRFCRRFHFSHWNKHERYKKRLKTCLIPTRLSLQLSLDDTVRNDSG